MSGVASRPFGMNNVGNTCFMNAALQLLGSSPSAIHVFLRGLCAQLHAWRFLYRCRRIAACIEHDAWPLLQSIGRPPLTPKAVQFMLDLTRCLAFTVSPHDAPAVCAVPVELLDCSSDAFTALFLARQDPHLTSFLDALIRTSSVAPSFVSDASSTPEGRPYPFKTPQVSSVDDRKSTHDPLLPAQPPLRMHMIHGIFSHAEQLIDHLLPAPSLHLSARHSAAIAAANESILPAQQSSWFWSSQPSVEPETELPFDDFDHYDDIDLERNSNWCPTGNDMPSLHALLTRELDFAEWFNEHADEVDGSLMNRQQQDSHEFLAKIMGWLSSLSQHLLASARHLHRNFHLDSTSVVQPRFKSLVPSSCPLQRCVDNSLRFLLHPHWLSFNASPPFVGLQGSELKCSLQHAPLVRCSEFSLLTMSMPAGAPTLSNLLQEYQAAQRLSDVVCPTCTAVATTEALQAPVKKKGKKSKSEPDTATMSVLCSVARQHEFAVRRGLTDSELNCCVFPRSFVDSEWFPVSTPRVLPALPGRVKLAAVKQMRLLHYPRVLLIHVARSVLEGVKVDEHVVFPLTFSPASIGSDLRSVSMHRFTESTDSSFVCACASLSTATETQPTAPSTLVSSLVSPSFSHLPSTSARIQYTLTAVVQHIGSGTGGHYICYRRFANRWFRMDDRNVVEVDALHVLRAQAYMVSYERV